MRFTRGHLVFFVIYSLVFLLVVFWWPSYTLHEFQQTREAVFSDVPQEDILKFIGELTDEHAEDLQIHALSYSLYGVLMLQPSNKEALFGFDSLCDSACFHLSVYIHPELKNPPWRKFCQVAGPELRCSFEEDDSGAFDILPASIVESAQDHEKVKNMYFKYFIHKQERGSIISSTLITLAITTLLVLLALLWYFLNLFQHKKNLRTVFFFLFLVLSLVSWIEILYPMHATAVVMGWIVIIGLFTPYAIVTFITTSMATLSLYKLGLFCWGRFVGMAETRDKIAIFAIVLSLILYIVGLPALIYFAGGSPPID